LNRKQSPVTPLTPIASGLFVTSDGTAKCYSATDNPKSPSYRGLLPEDLFDIISRHKLGYGTLCQVNQ
jgi:hypothetical protein